MTRIGNAQGKDGHIIMDLYERPSPPGSHINLEIPAEDDEKVIVGGGVIASDSPGKLITASFPKADLSAWIVSAKDHIVPDASPIRGFAIGLKMLDFRGLPVPKEDFMSFIHVTSVTSDVKSSPVACAPFWTPTQCKSLGGGFQVNWGGAGSLATCSAFDTSATGFTNASQDCWKAGSKDHGSPSPASITAYAISLEDPILGESYGYSVDWHVGVGQNSTPLAHQSADAILPPGVVMTGGGSEVFFSGAGNYLWKLEPFFEEQRQGFRGASKDHTIPDPAKMETRVFGIDLNRLP
jgi:hypothetical protein